MDWTNKQHVLNKIEQDGEAFQYADASLKKDKEVVLKAIIKNRYAFWHADASLNINAPH